VRANPAPAARGCAPYAARRLRHEGRGRRAPRQAIDNSRVVRQVDPRSRREILLLILLVAVLAAFLGLYAWPALEIRRADQAGWTRPEKQRLVEENRKLRWRRPLSRTCAASRRSRPGAGLAPPAPSDRSWSRSRSARARPEGRRRANAPPGGAERNGSGGEALREDRPPSSPGPRREGPRPARGRRACGSCCSRSRYRSGPSWWGSASSTSRCSGASSSAARHAAERAHDQPRPRRGRSSTLGPSPRALRGRGEPLRGSAGRDRPPSGRGRPRPRALLDAAGGGAPGEAAAEEPRVRLDPAQGRPGDRPRVRELQLDGWAS